MYQKQKKPSKEPVLTFKPEISKNSKIIASEKLQGSSFAPDGNTSSNYNSRSQSRSSQQKNFYERQMYHQQKKELIVKDEQMKKVDKELDGCTFKPVVIKPTLPQCSYIESEERHHALQDYLDGNSSNLTESHFRNPHKMTNSIRYMNDQSI